MARSLKLPVSAIVLSGRRRDTLLDLIAAPNQL
jgi:hypothetical protein